MRNRYKQKWDAHQAQRIRDLEERTRQRQVKVLEDRVSDLEGNGGQTVDESIDVLWLRSFR